eukprot:1650760-Amphidinium_carterae.4
MALKWDSALQLCKDSEVSDSRPDFQGLASGLATQALRQLKLDGQSQKLDKKTVLKAVEDLEHNVIVHHCPAWSAERREVELSASALGSRLGVRIVWTDGSGRHSSNPRAFLPLPGLKQSVYRAEFLAVVRALEECKPKRLVSDCKGVISCLHALKAGRRHPTCRHRDLESRALAALPAGVQIVWMKAHQTEHDADEGRVDRSDLQGNHQADLAANEGTHEHVPLEPSEEWKQWST